MKGSVKNHLGSICMVLDSEAHLQCRSTSRDREHAEMGAGTTERAPCTGQIYAANKFQFAVDTK